MVASQNRARGRAVAAVALMTLASLSVLAPPAGAQQALADNIRVAWGSVDTYDGQSASRATQFFDPSHSVRVNFTASNHGTSAQNDVPAWLYLDGVPTLRGRCFRMNFPAAPSTAVPSRLSAEATFVLPSALPAGGYNFTIRVNTPPPVGYVFDAANSGNCPDTNARVNPLLDDAATNEAFGFIVVGARVNYHVASIAWCQDSPSASGAAECARRYDTCDGHTGAAACEVSIPYTSESTSLVDSHFRVDVHNNGTWADGTDYGGACSAPRTSASCPRFPYTVNITVARPGEPTMFLTTGVSADNATKSLASDWWRSASFPLNAKAGNYTVTARIVWSDDLYADDNVETATAYVRYADFRISDSGFPTDPANALPYGNGGRLRGNVTFHSDGERPINDATRWRIYMDAGDRPAFNITGTFPNFAAGGTRTVALDWEFVTLPEQGNYLAPGQHTLVFLIDEDEAIHEPSETNNSRTITVYIMDASAPRFLDAPRIEDLNTTAPRSIVHAHEPVLVLVNATDDDPSSLSVIANFTTTEVPNGTSMRVPLTRAANSLYPDRYSAVVRNLSVLGNGSSTNWTMRIEARDAFGNTNTTSSLQVRVNLWPIQTMAPEDIVIYEPDGATYNWSGPFHNDSTSIRAWVKLMTDWTGFAKQETNLTNNLKLILQPPVGSNMTINSWAPTGCGGVSPPPVRIGQTVQSPPPTTDCFEYGIWRAAWIPGNDPPGLWNLSYQITDISGRVRYVNRTLTLVDTPARIELDDFPEKLNATQNLTISARVADDFDALAVELFANFTRSDGATTNISLGRPSTIGDGGWAGIKRNITTGAGRTLGLAGVYNLTFLAVDSNKNWNRTPGIPFELRDATRPILHFAGVTPSLQEIDTNVTFYASAHDETNMTVELRVRPKGSSEVVVGPVNLTPGLDGNYTYTTKFSAPGDFEWQIRVIDSVGLTTDSPATGQLTVRRNLGPRIELRSPAATIVADRYGPAAPRMEVLVYDNDGVDLDSIRLQVGTNLRPAAPVQFETAAAPSGLNGYLLIYQVPKSQAFAHGTQVTVNVSAIDKSGEALSDNRSFRFTVDAEEPVVTVADYTPRFSESGTGIQNVSLATRFVLRANDDDGLPTTVSTIWYTVSSVSQVSAQKTYTGPFRLDEVEGLQPRPGRYTIHFFAEDSVGNINRNIQPLEVDLDSSPPYANPYGAKPKGRDIALTLLDDGAGIDRAVVWHRTNNGTYEFVAMEPDGDVWRASLPQGRKADRIAYYVQAWDRVDNSATFGTAEVPYDTFLVPNHVPSLRITKPLQGDVVSRTIDVAWDSTDVDGDALVFTVLLKAPGSSSFAELSRIETLGRRSYSFDTSKHGDGDYTLRVQVNDGAANNQSDVSFSIRNKAGAIGQVKSAAGAVLPGEAMLVTAEVTKADPTAVEAHVFRDGVFVTSYAMRDDGLEGDEKAKDGTWSTRVALEDAGDYRVKVYTAYREDGVERNSTHEGVAFSVALTPGYILTTYAPLLALVALAAAVAIGVAAYVAFRRRP